MRGEGRGKGRLEGGREGRRGKDEAAISAGDLEGVEGRYKRAIYPFLSAL